MFHGCTDIYRRSLTGDVSNYDCSEIYREGRKEGSMKGSQVGIKLLKIEYA